MAQHPEGHNSIQHAEDFLLYVKTHPQERFWQALRNWSHHNYVFVADRRDIEMPDANIKDTFFFEGVSDA